ncbi:MAG: DUF1707 and DUF4870 domain-containing protein [Propionibacteriaceae bacterium]|nr:DUF1707 and DUF4870 domain-containing protein [Propionibacteriaceae bacterium]
MTSDAISDNTRDRAIELLQRAYAEGRINESELEHRLDLVFTATTYPQVRLALQDLPAPVPALAKSQTVKTPSRPSTAPADKAAFVHLSGLISGPVGPGIAWLLTAKDSQLNAEAAKALNFQVLSVILFAGGAVLSWIAFGLPVFLWGIAWVILTVIDGLKAGRGEAWENPVTQITGFRPIS